MVITALKREGHEVVELCVHSSPLAGSRSLSHLDHSNPPDMYHGLKLGYQLLFGDGGTYNLRSHLHVELILNFFLWHAVLHFNPKPTPQASRSAKRCNPLKLLTRQPCPF